MRRALTPIPMAALLIATLLAVHPVVGASSGWLDRSFGQNGTVDLRISGNDLQINALGLVRSPRGVVVLSNARFSAGAPEESTGYRLDALTTSGVRDGAFNGGAPVRAGYVSNGAASDVVAWGSRLLVVGSGSDVVSNFVRVDAYRWDGTLDDGFAGDGVAFLEVALGSGFHPHIAVLPDGRVRVCYAHGTDVFLWGLTVAGAPDATVGPGGVRSVEFGGARQCDEILADDAGRLVLAGDIGPGGLNAAIIGRFAANGDPDATFGTAGLTRLRWSARRFDAHSLVRLGSSGYVLAGQTRDDAPGSPGMAYTARFDANGMRVADYGYGGVYRYPGIVRGMDVAGNGRLVLGMATVVDPVPPARYAESLVRIDAATGRLDPTFGRNGSVQVFHRANDTVVDAIGRTITAGTRSNSTTSVLVQRRHP